MNSPQRWSPVRVAEISFCLFIIGYLGVLAVSVIPLSRNAAFFPKIILSLAALLALAKLASILWPRASRVIEPELHVASELPNDVPAPAGEADAAAVDGDEPAAPLWMPWLWLALSMAAIVAVGFLIGAGLAVFSYIRFVSRSSLVSAIATALVTVAFMYFMFQRAMRIDLGLGVFGYLLR